MNEQMRLRPGAVDWRVIDDEVVMLDGDASTYMATNPSGTLLWKALERGATRDALIDRLVEEYAIDRERAAADTDAYVDELRSRELLDGA